MTSRPIALLTALLAAVALSQVVAPAEASRAQQVPEEAPQLRWASMGDSFAAGEGIDGVGDATNLCARSPKAYGPLAATLLRDQQEWTITEAPFVACTGAVSADVITGGTGHQPVEAQLEALRKTGTRFDVITLSVGGNDVGFADVLKGCLKIPSGVTTQWPKAWGGSIAEIKIDGCDQTAEDLTERVNSLATARAVPYGKPDARPVPRLSDLYRSITSELLAEDGVLVISGYPRLIAPSSQWPQWRGNQCHLIERSDADLLNDATDQLEDVIRNEVTRADAPNRRVIYQSRLEIFDNDGDSKSLCSAPGTKWINGTVVGRIERSYHPNQQGYAATASDLANLLVGHFGTRFDPPPPSTVQETASEPEEPQVTEQSPSVTASGMFEIGDPFKARCTIAWPTAPMRSQRSITMRTSCGGVPGQYLFVDIVYGDPDLNVTPARSTMDVEGVIIDAGESEFGFGVLFVEATDITIR